MRENFCEDLRTALLFYIQRGAAANAAYFTKLLVRACRREAEEGR